MSFNVLVIEDDKEINSLLCKTLLNNGYNAVSALTGMQGLDCLKAQPFDMVLLDLMLPYKSGDAILQESREFSNAPVLVISAKETTQIKIDLLHLGADDYITKPFDIEEVMARIKANFRRISDHAIEINRPICYKDIIMDLSGKQVFINGKIVSLTATEFRLLELLMAHPKKVFSKANLFQNLWNEEYSVDDNTLNVHISRLRHKLKEINPDNEYIETLWGLGYRLAK